MDIVTYILALIAVLTLLAIVHEGGHFVAAKLARVAVESFEIGAGPAVFGFVDRAGTRYKLGVIPVGAFTTLAQDARKNPSAGGRTTFDQARPARKLGIALAGAVANFGVAFVILLGLQVGNFATPAPIIEIVDEEAAAFRAGLRTGDRIVAVDGVQTVGWQAVGLALFDRVGDSGALEMGVMRDGRLSEHPIAIAAWQSERRWIDAFDYLGIRHARASPSSAPARPLAGRLVAAVEEMVEITIETIAAGFKVVFGSLSIFSFAGPVQLTQLGEYVDSLDLLDCVKLFALCSIAAGMVNLLPGPIVDGTAVGLALTELASGKRLSAGGAAIGKRIGWVVGLTPLAAAILHESLRLLA